MNEENQKSPEAPKLEDQGRLPFLQRGDWLSFALTVLLTFGVYLFSINPNIDLSDSGVYATAGMYLGVPDNPGFPLWNVYAYLFTALLPISSIAWRVNVASATASALTCGMVALLASRCSGALLRDLEGWRRLNPKDESKLRLACGCVAGLALGFDGIFWSQAVVALPWNFSLLLLALTLTLFLRWQHAPEKNHWFCAACFMYGLALTNSQALLSAVPGLGCFILCVKPSLARDVFAVWTMILVLLIAGARLSFLHQRFDQFQQVLVLWRVYGVMAICTLVVTALLTVRTRKLFTHWKTVMISGVVFLAGLTPYFLVPLFSMANPPMNWGYPRTAAGFYHVISRGQYEVPNPAESFARFGDCLLGYGIKTYRDYGLIFICAAIIPFLFFHLLRARQRLFLLGLLGLGLSLSLFLVYVMNPSLDRASLDLNGRFFSSSHLVFSILVGCGLTLVGLSLCGSRHPITKVHS